MYALIRFVQKTQPNEWAFFEKQNPVNPVLKFCTAFNNACDADGLLSVLRYGFKHRGRRFRVCYFQPESALNQKDAQRYAQNEITCNRQWFYSDTTHNSVDMVLAVNGIPVFAFELKNQFTGQTVENSKQQWMHDRDPREVLALTREYGISARLTFSNSLLRPEHLSDPRCNRLCRLLAESPGPQNGVIVRSDLLLGHLRRTYPGLYFVSSTTKVLTEFPRLLQELQREEFRYVVPDFRLNKAFSELDALPQTLKDKVEFLCNECCCGGGTDRKRCYENVSRKNLGEPCPDHRCAAPKAAEGYRFSKAMASPSFIGVEDIRDCYLPMGFSQFKIEGRGLGSALILEFLLHYQTNPEYQLPVREAVYLDNMLDLF